MLTGATALPDDSVFLVGFTQGVWNETDSEDTGTADFAAVQLDKDGQEIYGVGR